MTGKRSLAVSLKPNLGEVIIEDVDADTTCAELKEYIAREIGAIVLKLIYSGVELKDQDVVMNLVSKEGVLQAHVDLAYVVPNQHTMRTKLGQMVWEGISKQVTPEDEEEVKGICQKLADKCIPEPVEPAHPTLINVKEGITEHVPIEQSVKLDTETLFKKVQIETVHEPAKLIVTKLAHSIQPILKAVEETGAPITLATVDAAVGRLMEQLTKYGSETPPQEILTAEMTSISQDIATLEEAKAKCEALGNVFSTEIESLEQVITTSLKSLSDKHISVVEKLMEHNEKCKSFEAPDLESLQKPLNEQQVSNDVEIMKCRKEIDQLSQNKKDLKEESDRTKNLTQYQIQSYTNEYKKLDDQCHEIEQIMKSLHRQYQVCQLRKKETKQMIRVKEQELQRQEEYHNSLLLTIENETQCRQKTIDLLLHNNNVLAELQCLNEDVCKETHAWRTSQRKEMEAAQQDHILQAYDNRYDLMDKLVYQKICSEGLVKELDGQLPLLQGKINTASRLRRIKEVDQLQEEKKALENDQESAKWTMNNAKLGILHCVEAMDNKILVLADKITSGHSNFKESKRVVVGDKVLFNPKAKLKLEHMQRQNSLFEREEEILAERQAILRAQKEEREKEMEKLKSKTNMITL